MAEGRVVAARREQLAQSVRARHKQQQGAEAARGSAEQALERHCALGAPVARGVAPAAADRVAASFHKLVCYQVVETALGWRERL